MGIVRELLSDEATRTVQLSCDQVFARLEIELRQVELQLPRLSGELR